MIKREKKIWLLEQYTQKIWTLSVSLGQEAVRMGGEFGKSYAIVANECRNMARKMFEATAAIKFEGCEDSILTKIIGDIALQMNLLSLNACLEMLHDKAENNTNTTRSIAVCVEEIRELAREAGELYSEKKIDVHEPIPEVISPINSTEVNDYFLKYSIGGVPLIESARTVYTIEYPAKSALETGIFNLRGVDVGVIDLYKKFNLKNDESDRQTVMTISHEDKNKIYAVPVDGVWGIINSKIGYNVLLEKNHAFSGYTRECWDAVGGGQLVFADWRKLIGK